MSNTTRQFHAAMRGEVRDPDEIDLQSDLAGVGGAGRIPIVGRVGDNGQPAAPATDDDDEEDGFDLSPEASLRAIQIAWREISCVRGIALAGLEGEGRRYALDILDGLDGWFDSQEKRLNLMIAARDKSGGAP